MVFPAIFNAVSALSAIFAGHASTAAAGGAAAGGAMAAKDAGVAGAAASSTSAGGAASGAKVCALTRCAIRLPPGGACRHSTDCPPRVAPFSWTKAVGMSSALKSGAVGTLDVSKEAWVGVKVGALTAGTLGAARLAGFTSSKEEASEEAASEGGVPVEAETEEKVES